jgi:hypothetical protein
VPVESDGAVVVVAVRTQRRSKVWVVLGVMCTARGWHAVRADLCAPGRVGRTRRPDGLDRAESRSGKGHERHRVRCDVCRVALSSTGHPGVEQLPDIALVLPRARRAHSSPSITAAHEDYPVRLTLGRIGAAKGT